MIYNWNEISLDTFSFMFSVYWYEHVNTLDKVIEVQKVDSIAIDEEVRVYFGYKIFINDWKQYNEEAFSILDELRAISEKSGETSPFVDYVKHNHFSMCIVENGAPRITPFGFGPNDYKLVSSAFDPSVKVNLSNCKNTKKLCLWYEKIGEKYLVNLNDPNLNNIKLRVRIMDYSDWKDMMNNFVKTSDFNILKSKDDIRKEQIKVSE